jgi:hypothetical protein
VHAHQIGMLACVYVLILCHRRKKWVHTHFVFVFIPRPYILKSVAKAEQSAARQPTRIYRSKFAQHEWVHRFRKRKQTNTPTSVM